MPRFSPAHLWKFAFARFASVGSVCFVLNLALLYLGVEVARLHYFLVSALSLFIVSGVAFLLNRRWTFDSNGAKFWPQLGRYYSVNLGSFVLNLGLIAVLVDGLKFHYLLANICVGIGSLLLNFQLHKNWSFNSKWNERHRK